MLPATPAQVISRKLNLLTSDEEASELERTQQSAVGSVLTFDEFELDVDEQQLRRCGTPLKVDALVLRLLEVFARNPGKLFSKDDLVTLVWDGRVVTENALTVAVARLRKTLEVGPGARDVVMTVYRRGYRFMRPVYTRDSEPRRPTLQRSAPQSAAPFVGRERTMAQLSTALNHARRGSGSMVVVSGEPGIGKTSVAELIAHQAATAGFAVAWGYCRELPESPPLWPVVGLLREVIGRLSKEARAEARFAALLPELAMLLPELATPQAVSSRLGADKPKHRVFDAVTRLLGLLAQTTPQLLILDDLQLADEATLELLQYLLVELPRTRIMLIATARNSTSVSSRASIARVLCHRSCSRVALTPLSEEQVESYLGGLFGAVNHALCRAVFETSEGNPFYMTELARQLRQSSKLEVAALSVPTLALDLVRQRLAHLSDSARNALTCAAVLGRSFSLPLLSAVTNRSASELMPMLDAALACEVIRAAPQSAMDFTFTNELLRVGLYEAQAPAQRRKQHLRVVRVLELRHALGEVPVSQLAHHAREALPEGDLHKAVTYCSEAAEAAARTCAFEDAIRYVQHAREALDLIEDASPQLRFSLLLRQASFVRGHGSDDFLPLAEQLLRLAREQGGGMPLAQACLLLDPFPGLPPLPVLRDALIEALRNLPEHAPGTRAALLARLTCSVPPIHDDADHSAQLERALETAAHSPELTDRVSAHFAELYRYGGPANKDRSDAAVHALSRLCNEQVAGPMAPLLLDLHRALTALQAGELATMERALERSEQRCRDLDAELHWHVERFRALAHINQGHATEGRSELLKLHRRAQPRTSVGIALFRAYDRSVLLEPGQAHDACQLALAPHAYDAPNVWAMKVRALAAIGSTEEASSALALMPVERLADLPCDREFLGTFGALARAALHLQAEPYARVAYERLAPFPQYFAVNVSFLCEGSVSLLLGLLARSFGELKSARRHFETALTVSQHAGLAPCAAEARMELNHCA